MRRETAVGFVGLGIAALIALVFAGVLRFGLRLIEAIALTNAAAYIAAIVAGCVLIAALAVMAALLVAILQLTSRLWTLMTTVPDPALRVWDDAGQPLEYIGQVTEMPKRGDAAQVVDAMADATKSAVAPLHKRSA